MEAANLLTLIGEDLHGVMMMEEEEEAEEEDEEEEDFVATP